MSKKNKKKIFMPIMSQIHGRSTIAALEIANELKKNKLKVDTIYIHSNKNNKYYRKFDKDLILPFLIFFENTILKLCNVLRKL